jgi:hypothetical protein
LDAEQQYLAVLDAPSQVIDKRGYGALAPVLDLSRFPVARRDRCAPLGVGSANSSHKLRVAPLHQGAVQIEDGDGVVGGGQELTPPADHRGSRQMSPLPMAERDPLAGWETA